eukprot:GHVT01019331.1.p1 GENE.GHVT01019331.1~~GHVT01019331.1.p1  ORF type:complete len:102 (-),score=15.68 GHVT01019331.1:624-929(-)
MTAWGWGVPGRGVPGRGVPGRGVPGRGVPVLARGEIAPARGGNGMFIATRRLGADGDEIGDFTATMAGRRLVRRRRCGEGEFAIVAVNKMKNKKLFKGWWW